MTSLCNKHFPLILILLPLKESQNIPTLTTGGLNDDVTCASLRINKVLWMKEVYDSMRTYSWRIQDKFRILQTLMLLFAKATFLSWIRWSSDRCIINFKGITWSEIGTTYAWIRHLLLTTILSKIQQCS